MPSKTSIFGNRIRSGSIPITALGGGVVSSSLQFNTLTAPFTGSFTGSYTGSYTGSFIGTGTVTNAELLYYANI